jgi:hypothetical protein
MVSQMFEVACQTLQCGEDIAIRKECEGLLFP